ncbi:MAG TPA: CBS domain-containing protein [Firmicutes bacterium]|nr:CBS domain-containing protein [Bacillota bacterium]
MKPAPQSFTLAEIAGIPVRLHWTFLLFLAFMLVANTLRAGLAASLGGIGFIIALFLSVTLHEFGHSLMARKFGIKVRDITLLPIGGVSQLETIPDDPKQEFLVAVAGPAVSLALAFIFFVLMRLTGFSILSPRYASPAQYLWGGRFLASLASANLILGLFNIIPAFPMDGGRVLRSLLAQQMNYIEATRIAAAIGQGFAFLFALLGLFSNPWLIFVALFIYMGAGTEERTTEIRRVLGNIPVHRVMTTFFERVSPDEPLARVLEYAYRGCQEDFPVVDGDTIKGVLTKASILAALHEKGPDIRVSEAMLTDYTVLSPNDMLAGVYERMQACNCSSLPVLQDGKLVGMVGLENIGRFFMYESARQHAKKQEEERVKPPVI